MNKKREGENPTLFIYQRNEAGDRDLSKDQNNEFLPSQNHIILFSV